MCLYLSIPGRIEFAPEEDAHVVGDCVKVTFCNYHHVLEKKRLHSFNSFPFLLACCLNMYDVSAACSP